MSLETEYQAKLKSKLELMFPDCIVLKNDPTLNQGIPDLSIMYKSRWAFLECKRSVNERTRPNQEYYVEVANTWAFGAIIYPENETEVLTKLYDYFTY